MGHNAYDFRTNGFHFKQIDPEWESWGPWRFIEEIRKNPICQKNFEQDLIAMRLSKAFLLVNPCGKSAHLEIGWAIGRGLRTAILLLGKERPELMYRMAGEILVGSHELHRWLLKLRHEEEQGL